MELKFFSIEEVKEFVKGLKGTRGAKGEADDGAAGNAPAPMMPNPNAMTGNPAFNPGGYVPQGVGAGPGGAAFPATAAQMGPAPEVLAMVQRLANRIDWSCTPTPNGGGADVNNMLAWFRSQLGPETANYTLDQIKQVALPRASLPALTEMAKLMGA